MRVLVCVCAITALAVPAVAQTYPFEPGQADGRSVPVTESPARTALARRDRRERLRVVADIHAAP